MCVLVEYHCINVVNMLCIIKWDVLLRFFRTNIFLQACAL